MIYEYIYKGLDTNDEFFKQNQIIENIEIGDMKTAQEHHKDFKTMIITPERIEAHNLADDFVFVKDHLILRISK